MSMTHGSKGGTGNEEAAPPPRPPSQQSSGSGGSGSSKHVKCIGRYVLTGNTLGKGNFARVEAAVHTLTRAKVAVKIIETDKIKEDYVRKNLLREAQLMRRLHHPNIIRLYETMKTNNLYCLVTEIADGGELLSHVRNDFKERRLPEATTRPFIRQLASALHHLHTTGIVHRDLKMENILLDKKKRNIKIVDFGLSNSTKPGGLLQTHCGSPEYAAPELFIPGREYGPEVDVWSLGVNLYAMLVGKLPFRSPRQGTRRRQKLLEQISNGLSEYHEKEMAHITSSARDLIGRLLQPDPRRRVRLSEVMQHPWVTKNGEQPLLPYQEQPVDHATKSAVIELMSTVLEISPSEIKDAVKRDRCDWLAAIYNLLIDQPEGRNIIQQLMTDNPEDQLVDAAHYHGSMQHLRLSQADSLDSPEAASALTSSKAPTHRTGYRHSMSQPYQEGGDYAASTLPLTKREKKHHHTQESRPLGAPRTLNPLQHPSYMSARRASIASPINSPEHQQTPYQPNRDPILSHYYHPVEKKRSRGRRLPTTPSEEPYHRPSHEPPRPHSRAESMPDPLPAPWRPNIAHLSKPTGKHSPDTSTPPNALHEDSKQGQHYREPVAAPLALGHLKPSKKKGSLKPIRPKSSMGTKGLSASVEGNLQLKSIDSQHAKSVMWPPQVAPVQVHGHPVPVGWPSANNIYRSRTLPRGRDIQALMGDKSVPSAYSSIRDIPAELNQLQADNGSIVSVDIQQELFKPQHPRSAAPPTSKENVMEHRMLHQETPKPHTANPHIVSLESLKVDPISGGDLARNHGHPRQLHPRSTSAKHHQQIPSGYMGHRQELSTSAGYMNTDVMQHHHLNGDIHYDNEQEKLALLKNDGHKNVGRAFHFRNSRERSASTSVHSKAL